MTCPPPVEMGLDAHGRKIHASAGVTAGTREDDGGRARGPEPRELPGMDIDFRT